MAGGIFGAVRARYDDFTPIWAICAALALVRLALLLGLAVSDRAGTARRVVPLGAEEG